MLRLNIGTIHWRQWKIRSEWNFSHISLYRIILVMVVGCTKTIEIFQKKEKVHRFKKPRGQSKTIGNHWPCVSIPVFVSSCVWVSVTNPVMSLIVTEKLHQKIESRRWLIISLRLLVQTQHLLANLKHWNALRVVEHCIA